MNGNEGSVYILVNSSIPNLVKIGRTSKAPSSRAQELSSTGTPGRFVVAYSVLVNDCVEIESAMHAFFANQRHTDDREFFEVDPSVATDKLIEISAGKRLLVVGDSLAGVRPGSATFYCIRVNAGKNIFRIGLINKPHTCLSEENFKSAVIAVYNTFDNNFFYECETVCHWEFSSIDKEAIDDMLKALDDYLMMLKNDENGLFNHQEYDLRTLYYKSMIKPYPEKIFSYILTRLEPFSAASSLRFEERINLAKKEEYKRLLNRIESGGL